MEAVGVVLFEIHVPPNRIFGHFSVLFLCENEDIILKLLLFLYATVVSFFCACFSAGIRLVCKVCRVVGERNGLNTF